MAQEVERPAKHLADGAWKTTSPAWLAEARRLLDHLSRHGGRTAVDSPRLNLRPVSLPMMPGWWAAEATRLVTTWRPPPAAAGQKEPGSMISSPSS
ncbi:hypothetical protein SUDANB105_00702 [Streptomyces sp. enrichment culture]|uniref:hypothetical protein n=1 Tax=Streptomyces sp. enrichment culture TaxID=1795815 RepID=UPI003F54994A